jgi:LemA protein
VYNMMHMNKTILTILGVVALFAFYTITKFNGLTKQNVAIDAQWAQVDSVLQRRFDSIEQTVGALKVSNKNELEAIRLVTEARKIYTAASGSAEAQVAAANNYGGALNGLLLARSTVGENYPNLKTPDLVGGLIGGVTVEGNENRINVERMRYNDLVKDFNVNVSTFPANMFASRFGFNKRSFFEVANPEAKNAPKIAPDLKF